MNEDLVYRLRVWSRRFEPRSPERKLMLEAAEALEALPPPTNGITVIAITAEMVEAAMGGKKLLPWQRDALTPPAFRGH